MQRGSRYVAGKTFYPTTDGGWVDALVQAHPEAKREKVAFNSDAYFALLRKSRDLAQWLSLGPRVQVMIDQVVVEVSDE